MRSDDAMPSGAPTSWPTCRSVYAAATSCDGSLASVAKLDNLRAGITWAAEVDDADLALRQLGELSAMSLSQRTEGYRLCPLAALALSTSGALDHPHAATALTMRAVDHLHLGELDDAEHDALEAIGLIRDGTSKLMVDPWVVLMLLRVSRGTIGPPSEDLEEFLSVTSTLADPFLRAMASGMVASWYFANNEPDEALPYAEQAMELASASETPPWRAWRGSRWAEH